MSSQADDRHWAVIEFADAELGDVRRTKRLVELAGVLAQHPTAALPEACGDAAMLTAAYRFFDNDAIEPPDVLQSPIEATYHRLEQVPLVLAVQDTTAVDWTAHPATKHLGPLGPTACQGLLVHSQGHSVVELEPETDQVCLGARASRPLRKQAGRLRSQEHTEPKPKTQWPWSIVRWRSHPSGSPQAAAHFSAGKPAMAYES